MADYRQIHTCIWKDSWFLELAADYKLLFIYLFSNERACLAGLYDLSLKVIAFETDLPSETIESGLEQFARDGKAFYEDGMIWIPTLLKHNAKNITSPRIQAHLKSSLALIRDCPLKRRWIEYYNQMIPYAYRMDTSKKIATEHEHEHEHEHEQDTMSGADAPAANAAPSGNGHPTTFQEWQAYIQDAKGKRGGMQAAVHYMIKTLYSGLDPPAFSYIASTARKVGGFGRLADLLWQHSTRPPTGDLLAYIQRIAKNGNYSGKSERKTQEPAGVIGWTDE